MKSVAFSRYPRRALVTTAVRTVLLSLSLCFASSLVFPQNQATNPAPRWLPNKQVRKMWGNAPIETARQAAEAGDVTAQDYLGMCYLAGDRVGADSAAALSWFRRASEAGFLSSTRKMGLLYQQGKGVTQDYAKALELYRIAADGGDPAGEFNVGVVFRDGLGVTRDQDEAMKWFRRSAEHGQPEAMYELYLRYQNGTGVERDPEEARKWLLQSAEAGSGSGQCELGYYNEFRIDWDPVYVRTSSNNMPEAVRWYRLSADQGHAGGQFHLALCYLQGKGVEQDEERGLELIRKSSDQNHHYAMVKLADLYARGIGQPRSEQDRPMALLLRAGEAGFEDAWDALASRYQNGLGTDRDLIVACGWYCRGVIAAPRRHPAKGGTVFPSADSVQPRDPYSAAWVLYMKGAGLNDKAALMQIASMYLAGRSVPQSEVKAWPWLKLAAETGATEAHTRIAELESHLSQEELKEAQQSLAQLAQQTNNAARAARMAFGSAGR